MLVTKPVSQGEVSSSEHGQASLQQVDARSGGPGGEPHGLALKLPEQGRTSLDEYVATIRNLVSVIPNIDEDA